MSSSLRPPSTSPSPSPAPPPSAGLPLKPINTRASLQPLARSQGPSNHTPLSPRPSGFTPGARPTSELITGGNIHNGGGGGNAQTPEFEALDQWFENLQNYETTLEEMAAASLDVNFKEELSAIEQWFRVLSEAERTAALYSLLQHSTQMQIRFFITVLQQMARSDPVTALLSPAVGGSMQNQMEAKLASMGLKSPGIGPSSPRTFSQAQRQSFGGDPSSYLSPDSAASPATEGPAATLAHQRAKLKANAAHRISAPGNLINDAARGNLWTSSQLGQVVERNNSPSPEPPTAHSASSSSLSPPLSGHNARPKSTGDFSGVGNSYRSPRPSVKTDNLDDQLSPINGGNWASMVNTPVGTMFSNDTAQNSNNLDAASLKLANWTAPKVMLDDARKFRRNSKNGPEGNKNSGGMYGDDGDLVAPSSTQPGGGSNNNIGQQKRNVSGGNGSNSGPLGGGGGGSGFLSPNPAWSGGARSPGLSSVSSDNSGLNGLGFGGLNPAMMGLGAMGNLNGMAGMNGMPGFNMFNGMPNMMGGMEGMGLNPVQAQLFAAQLAAGGYNPMGFGGMGMGMGGMQNNVQGGGGGPRSTRGGSQAGGRSPGKPGPASLSSRGGGNDKDKEKEEEVDPSVLGDVPAWLRSLRLHKYTPNFEGMSWKDMVVLDEAALEAKGVAALGARRKMLKTFEAVRNKMGVEA